MRTKQFSKVDTVAEAVIVFHTSHGAAGAESIKCFLELKNLLTMCNVTSTIITSLPRSPALNADMKNVLMAWFSLLRLGFTSGSVPATK
jgi:hypothetical protein